jgi:CRISPR type III-A-associated RAMP protein Csm5
MCLSSCLGWARKGGEEMLDIKPSVDMYEVEIEAITPISVGGGEETVCESYEYFINQDEGRIYFITLEDLVNLYNLGFIREEELEYEYSKLIENIFKIPEAKKYLKSVKIAGKVDNRLRLYKFARIKEFSLEKQILKEKPVIFGSTLKGILRTGCLVQKVRSCKYDFDRKNNKLILKKAVINKKEVFNNEVYKQLFNISDYDVSLNIGNSAEEENWVTLEEFSKKTKRTLTSDDILTAIFRNIVCSDLSLKAGELMVEKVIKFNRRSKKFKEKMEGIPLYFEMAQPGTKFIGQIKYKNDTGNYDKQLSIISIQNRNLDEEYMFLNPVEECFSGLRKMSRYVIEAESRILQDSFLGKQVKNFYRMLEKENEKEGQCVFKIGYSGILAKTLMAFDEDKVKNNNLYLPYTINVAEETKLPIGWVKIAYSISSNEEY